MRAKLNNLSIAKKLIISFTLITIMFLAVLIYSAFFTANIRDTQRYLSDYVLTRNRILIDIQAELRNLNTFISATVNNQEWLDYATIDDALQFNSHIDNVLHTMQVLVHEYIELIEADLFADVILDDYERSDMVIIMIGTVLENVEAIHSYSYITLSPFVMHTEPPLPDLFPVFSTPSISLVEHLRELNLELVSVIGENLYGQQSQYFNFSLIALMSTAMVALGALWVTVSNLKKRMSAFGEKADIIKQGDFSVNMHDEGDDEVAKLSNIIAGVIDTFENLINQIDHVTTDLRHGNTEARIDTSKFLGRYYVAAASINVLAEEIMGAANLKIEKEYNDYVRAIMESVPLVITYWSDSLELLDCNNEVIRRYKVKDKKEYLDTFFLFSPAVQPDGSSSEEKALYYLEKARKQDYLKFEWMHQDIEGNPIPSEIVCHRGKFRGNNVIFSYAVDMRDFHKAVEEAKRSASVEEESQAKTRFLARMSHEIRTPISAVLGISEIQLQNPSLPMSVEEAFAKIYNSSQALLRIINDILDLSKIEAGKLTIMNEEYETASLINDMVQLNVFRLGSKNLKFNIHIDENIPYMLKGDELRIKQIMNNLLSNAFKYTEEGHVTLVIKFNEDKEDRNNSCLQFTVEDTGCGMSEEDLNVLFSEFSRFNEEKHYRIEGTGLGMTIVNSLIQSMNADIKVDSAVNVGTTFELEIPQEKASEKVLGKELVDSLSDFKMTSNRFTAKQMLFTPDPMPYGKVLVVDDVETNLYVAKGILSFYSIDVKTCDSGYGALDLVKDGNVYDVIFLDHMMPGMDGIETIGRIRAEGYTHPIVALTANALIGQSEMFLEKGFDGFISKPIDTSRLNTLLNKFIRDKQPPEVVEAARKNAELASQNRQAKSGAWEFFTGAAGDDPSNEFLISLRAGFAKSQKSVADDIRDALEKGDITSCRRFAHTLKGLARTIKENDLASTAGKLEAIFEHNEIDEETPKIIDIMEEQLKEVLKDIPTETVNISRDDTGENLDIDTVNKLLQELELLLEDDSAYALQTAENLRGVPQADVLVRQIENFDFEDALKTLIILKEILT
ncbi:MAG: ATP-binding protein [Defluviitaleaceae bacterium]|nr:ATP-binding protein [Defluviitaleaceae bacterium]